MKQEELKIAALLIALIGYIGADAKNLIENDSTTTAIPRYEIADEPSWHKYVPTIYGTLRGKYEWSPQIGASRFQVRTARIGVSGDVLDNVSYKADIDFCDEGKIKVLDVFGKLTMFERQFSVALGQMRLPFSVDAKRGPGSQFFANRSFLAKQVGNVRDVGVTLSYNPTNTKFNVEAGVYNGNGLTNQTPWNQTMIYAGRMNYTLSGIKAEVGFQSQRPDQVRINLVDVSLSWTYGNFFIEGEYMNKHYTNNAYKTVHGYNIQALYSIPMRKIFNSISVLGRWDSMTDHSDGKRDDMGKLSMTHPGRNRLTGGLTFSFFKKIGADIRLNYEKYFYHDDMVAVDDNGHDKLVVELVVNF